MVVADNRIDILVLPEVNTKNGTAGDVYSTHQRCPE
jgi:hypothetical protein